MDDFSTRWKQHPEIGFEHQRILTVNNRFIELADVSGPMVADYIEFGREKIDHQLHMINKLRKYRSEPKHILLGRLALGDYEDTALTFEGMKITNEADIHSEHLLKSYQVFWHIIDSALYTPVVERNAFSDYPSLEGTWLGLRKPQ